MLRTMAVAVALLVAGLAAWMIVAAMPQPATGDERSDQTTTWPLSWL